VKLLESVRIGNVELRNRIVMLPMHLGFCEDGKVGERITEFYRERAQGGVGLIVVGGCTIDKHSAYWGMVSLQDDSYIPGHRQLNQVIKSLGAKTCAQLFQAGRYATSRYSGIQPIAPSPIASSLTREVPREMTEKDIEEVIQAFAAAARRAVEAGYDMVEVIASAGYLISQFFSPLTNQRDDEYGGDFENRCRFGVEVIKAVRTAIGSDYPISVRLSGNEFMQGGNGSLEMARFAARLEQAGANLFSVTGGWHESRVPQITMNVPPGAYSYLARTVKEAVNNSQVIACNRINDPVIAEQILIEGQADLVGMARGLMADPELPRKLEEGRWHEIRKCIGCNQGCLDAIFVGGSCRCLVNARAGREAQTRLRPVERPKKVLVIGGGPAGMEAARVAATRGHDVTLWEKEVNLGGQLELAAAIPGRQDFVHLIDYLEDSLVELGVNVETQKEADIGEIKRFGPDAVVIATGARPIMPDILGIDSKNVVGAWEVLAFEPELGKRVVIIGGGAVGCEVALFIARMGTIDADTVKFLLLNEAEPVERIRELAQRGTKEVVVVEQDKNMGRGIGISTRWIILQELARMGVQLRPSTKVIAIEEDGVVVSDPQGRTEKIPADAVVVAVGSKPANSLYEEIKQAFPETYLIGDAKEPRKALEAVHEGFDVGNAI